MKHIISVIAKNESGVLSRISNLFSSRGYKIDSLTIAPSVDEKYARATITTAGDDAVIEQIIKQLNKLVPVLSVTDMCDHNSTTFELVFVKVKMGAKLDETIKKYNGEITSIRDEIATIQFVCEEANLSDIVNELTRFEILDIVRSGAVSI